MTIATALNTLPSTGTSVRSIVLWIPHHHIVDAARVVTTPMKRRWMLAAGCVLIAGSIGAGAADAPSPATAAVPVTGIKSMLVVTVALSQSHGTPKTVPLQTPAQVSSA